MAKDQMDFINEAADTLEGFEQINAQTMAIPFVRIAQRDSPAMNKNKPEYIEGLKEAEWFNTVTNQIYGETLEVIVLKFEQLYLEWKPKRTGFAGYHSPENAERLAVDKTFGKWKMSNGNEIQETYTYICLVNGQEQEGVVVLTFSSSTLPSAREWNRLMTTHIMDNGKRALPYYLKWKLATIYKENEKGSWFIPKISYNGYISKAQYQLLGPERKALPDRRVDYAQLSENNTDEVDGVEY